MPENYSSKYIEETFYRWYESGMKISPKFANSLPADEQGKAPTFKTIEKWRDAYGWVDRAEELDNAISKSIQDTIVGKRTAMYEEHATVANKLVQKGREFLESHSIDTMADALKAISLGVEIERVSVGQADLGRKIMSMSDEQLTSELQKYLKPPTKDSEFIEGETLEDD